MKSLRSGGRERPADRCDTEEARGAAPWAAGVGASTNKAGDDACMHKPELKTSGKCRPGMALQPCVSVPGHDLPSLKRRRSTAAGWEVQRVLLANHDDLVRVKSQQRCVA